MKISMDIGRYAPSSDIYLSGGQTSSVAGRFNFGVRRIDDALGDGLARGGVHEIFLSHPKDVATALGFTLALALMAAGAKSILISQQDFLDGEAGAINADGLNEMGIDPPRVILVHTPNAEGALRAGEQAVRCTALGAVVIETWGEPKILGFTASRRLSLASAKSNVPIFIFRAAARPSQSAAATRWSVGAAPSRALEANAPGFPAFDLTLLRHRGGTAGHNWRVEWDRDQRRFRDRHPSNGAQISGDMVPVYRDRQAASPVYQGWRRAG